MLGLALRFVLAALSRGSNDAAFGEEFAWHISQFGIRSLYDHEPYSTHPPLRGGWAFLSFQLAETPTLRFVPLKLPGILGDCGTSITTCG